MDFPRYVKAVYSWSGEEKSDLGFVEGDVIEVLNTGDGNWWTGQLKRNKVTGLFPKNFVEAYNPKGGISGRASPNPLNSSISSSVDFQQSQPNTPKDNLDVIDAGIANMVEQLSISQGMIDTEEVEQEEGDIIDGYTDSAWNYENNEPYSDSHTTPEVDLETPYGNTGEFEETLYSKGTPGYHEEPHIYQDDENHCSDISYEENYENDMPDLPNTPPVPPPHASLLSSQSRIVSDSTATPRKKPGSIDLDMTPSPLRHAMDGVLESLENLNEFSRENSQSSKVQLLNKPGQRNSMMTLTGSSCGNTSAVDHTMQVSSLNISPRKSTLRQDSSNDMDDENDTDMPFNPDSYNNSAIFQSENQQRSTNGPNYAQKHNGEHHQTSTGVTQLPMEHSVSETQFGRTDTYKSISSVHTNSLSIMSSSTTPTSLSNFSATSAGSLARRTQGEQLGSCMRRLSSDRMISETPMKLPNTKGAKVTSDAISVKSLKLKRSAGFLRKLFTGSSEKQQQEEQYGSTYESSSLRRTKSRSSRMSVSSTSSRFRNSLRGFGRSKTDSQSLYSRKSTDGLGLGYNWMDIRRDVHRSNSLVKNEIQERRRKIALSGIPVVEPYIALGQVQGRESVSGHAIPSREQRKDPALLNYSSVDEQIRSIRTWPQLMTPHMFAQSKIGRQFHVDTDRIRAIFNFCAGKLSWVPIDALAVVTDDYDDEIMKQAKLMQYRKGNSFDIASCFKSMCESLGITCDVVHGHLKSPGEITDKPSPVRSDHAWNSLLVNNEWRFVDCSLANPTFTNKEYYSLNRSKSVKTTRGSTDLLRSTSSAGYGSMSINRDDSGIDYFFFLIDPLKLIHTHIPCTQTDQHIVPPLKDSDALGLPLAGPGSFANSLKLVNYHTALTRLENLQVAELNIMVPNDVEIFADVLAGNIFNMSLVGGTYDETQLAKVHGLAQAYWENGKRYFRVKAFLPEPFSQGILNIFAGPRGALQSVTKNTLPLAYSIGITHNGSNAPFEFVTRHPTPHCRRQDIYIMQPQCKQLSSGNVYVFEVKQHPSGGITSSAGLSRVKIAIQSPSGKISKLSKKDTEDSGPVFGRWEVNVKCHEIGTWRGLVLADSGSAWSVFAEWDCV